MKRVNPSEGSGHFPNFILKLSEQFQASQASKWLGWVVVNAFTGSSSPAYRQLLWHSEKQQHVQTVPITADRYAGPIPRLWRSAVILGVSALELNNAREQHPHAPHAVAYASDDVLHVGTGAGIYGIDGLPYASRDTMRD